jgi:hypothetical protein
MTEAERQRDAAITNAPAYAEAHDLITVILRHGEFPPRDRGPIALEIISGLRRLGWTPPTHPTRAEAAQETT